MAERSGRAPQLLLQEITPARPRSRRIFMRTAAGDISGFADRRESIDLVWTRVPQAATGP